MEEIVFSQATQSELYPWDRGATHLILKLSRKTSFLPPSCVSTASSAALLCRRFASLSFSISISIQDSTPVQRLTRATLPVLMTEVKNSAWRRDGVGGVRGRAEVTIREDLIGLYATRSKWAFGGDSRTRTWGRASCNAVSLSLRYRSESPPLSAPSRSLLHCPILRAPPVSRALQA